MLENSEKNLIYNESKTVVDEIIENILKDLKIYEKNLIKTGHHEKHSENQDKDEASLEFDTECNSCHARESSFWRRIAKNKIVCNNCFFNKTYLITINDGNKNSNNQANSEKKTRSNNKIQPVCNILSISNKRSLSTQLSSSSNASTLEQIEYFYLISLFYFLQ